MKSLQESLFDNDLSNKKLPIQKIIENFDSDSLGKLSVQDRNEAFKQLFEMGAQYDAAEMKKNPVDLKKNILIVRRDKLIHNDPLSEPCHYVFVHQNSNDHYERCALMDIISPSGKLKYYWDGSVWKDLQQFPTWKGKVSRIYNFYGGVSFSVLDEKISANVIKGIIGK